MKKGGKRSDSNFVRIWRSTRGFPRDVSGQADTSDKPGMFTMTPNSFPEAINN